MGTTKTAEEVKKEQQSIMGPELGSLYNLLYNETIWLHYKWTEFEELYGVNESRIKLMNQTAPFFFFIIQKVLWENILLGIARITDRSKIGDKKNISIQALPDLIENQELKEKIKIEIKEILLKTKFCRDWRNRWIAHYDYNLSLDSNAQPLETANRKLLKESLKQITAFINILHDHYFKSRLMLDYIKSDRGAHSLLHTLKDGLRERDNYFNRLSTGNLLDYDYDNTEI